MTNSKIGKNKERKKNQRTIAIIKIGRNWLIK